MVQCRDHLSPWVRRGSEVMHETGTFHAAWPHGEARAPDTLRRTRIRISLCTLVMSRGMYLGAEDPSRAARTVRLKVRAICSRFVSTDALCRLVTDVTVDGSTVSLRHPAPSSLLASPRHRGPRATGSRGSVDEHHHLHHAIKISPRFPPASVLD